MVSPPPHRRAGPLRAMSAVSDELKRTLSLVANDFVSKGKYKSAEKLKICEMNVWQLFGGVEKMSISPHLKPRGSHEREKATF